MKKKTKTLLCQQCGTETRNFSVLEIEDIYKTTAKLAVVCRECKKHFRVARGRLGLIPRQFWEEHSPHVEYQKLDDSTSFKFTYIGYLKSLTKKV